MAMLWNSVFKALRPSYPEGRPFTSWHRLAVALAAAAPVLLVGAPSLVYLHGLLNRAAVERRQALADIASVTIREKLDHVSDLTLSLASRVEFRELVSQGRWEEAILILRDVPGNFPFVNRVFLVDRAGVLRADWPRLPGVRGRGFSYREWYRGVARAQAPFISGFYLRSVEPRIVVVACAAPVRDKGGLKGYLVLQVEAGTLVSWLRDIRLEGSASVYLVDHEGNTVFSGGKPGPLHPVGAQDPARRALQGLRGVLTCARGGGKFMTAVAPVKGGRWAAAVEQPLREVYAARDLVLAGLFLLVLAAAALSGFLADTLVGAAVRLEKTAAGLREANSELEAFNYAVSHDLRAPIRRIAAFISLLEQECAGEVSAEGRGYLARISKGCGQLAAVVDGLLKLSRAIHLELKFEEVDLSALAAEAAERLAAAGSGRVVRFKAAQNLRAAGDAGLLREVMENLLDNAWKFTRETENAAVEFGTEERDGETVYFVKDNGKGFDMKSAGKLFQPFQRLHSPDEFPGTGVGLNTVRRIVERHGGRIWAEAAEDKGAVFYFTINPPEKKGPA
jgi:signal transduction histidine kinase